MKLEEIVKSAKEILDIDILKDKKEMKYQKEVKEILQGEDND